MHCIVNHKSMYGALLEFGLFCLQPVHIFERSEKEAVVASCFMKLVPSRTDRHMPGMDFRPNLNQVLASFLSAGVEVGLS